MQRNSLALSSFHSLDEIFIPVPTDPEAEYQCKYLSKSMASFCLMTFTSILSSAYTLRDNNSFSTQEKYCVNDVFVYFTNVYILCKEDNSSFSTRLSPPRK